MSNWTKKDIEKLQEKVKSVAIAKEPKKRIVIPKLVGKEKIHIEHIIKCFVANGKIERFEEEYEFDSKRKFRFDWAIPENKIAIEYEGIFGGKSRHTTLLGYTKDCEKYNLAIYHGWRVLRYTAKNYKDIKNDLNKILK